MKKSKTAIAYVLVPLILLAVFVPIYLSWSSGYDARQQAVADAHKREIEATLQAQNEQRIKAINDANAEAARRKKERADKEERDHQRAAQRDAAEQANEKAQRD